MKTHVEADTKSFFERCQVIHMYFPELIDIKFRDFPAAVANARLSLATDFTRVRSLTGSIWLLNHLDNSVFLQPAVRLFRDSVFDKALGQQLFNRTIDCA